MMLDAVLPTPHDVKAQLARILAAPAFQGSKDLTDLLTTLTKETVEGRGDQLTERWVGVHVLGKPANWNPKTARASRYGAEPDTAVRTDMSRLRKALKEYYETEGARDPVVIEFPKPQEQGRAKGQQRYAASFRYQPGVARYPGLPDHEAQLITMIKRSLMLRSVKGDAAARAMHTALRTAINNPALIYLYDAFISIAQSHFYDRHGRQHLESAREHLDYARTKGPVYWEGIFIDAVLRAMNFGWEWSLELFEEARLASDGESLYFWWHTAVLAALGKTDQAIALLEQALSEPSGADLVLRIDLATLYILSERYDAALAELQGIGAGPHRYNHLGYVALAMLCDAKGDYKNANETVLRIDGSLYDLNVWGYCYSSYLVGRTGDVMKSVEAYGYFKNHGVHDPSAYAPALGIAMAALGCGLDDEAAQWLHRAAFQEHDSLTVWIPILPCFKPLHHHHGFLWLLEMIKLPPRTFLNFF